MFLLSQEKVKDLFDNNFYLIFLKIKHHKNPILLFQNRISAYAERAQGGSSRISLGRSAAGEALAGPRG